MKSIHYSTAAALLILEVLVLTAIYFCGTDGITRWKELTTENKKIELQMASLETEINVLEQQVTKWQSNQFFKEQIARQQLQMARSDETIYFLD